MSGDEENRDKLTPEEELRFLKGDYDFKLVEKMPRSWVKANLKQVLKALAGTQANPKEDHP